MPIIQMFMTGAAVFGVIGSPNPVTGTSTSPTQASASCTAVVTGGVGPFTYAWSILTGVGVTLTNATTATCVITTNTGSVQLRNGTLQCIVTDTGNGSTTTSTTVPYTLEVL